MAAVVAIAGLIAAGTAVVTTTPVDGYISEAGVVGAPLAGMYRVGVLGHGVAALLLGFAVRGVAIVATRMLVLAALLAVVSAEVSCSRGCPLPPYERPTVADLVHTAASIAGLALMAFAMVAVAFSRSGCTARSVSRWATPVVLPLLVLALLAVFLGGRGVVSGVLERIAVTATSGWIIAAGVAVGRLTPAEDLLPVD